MINNSITRRDQTYLPSGGASFLVRVALNSASSSDSIRRIKTLTALRTTLNYDMSQWQTGACRIFTYSSIDVLKTRGDTLADVLELALVLGRIHGERIKNEDLTPLSALVESSKELGHSCGIQLEESGAGVVVVDFR